MTESALIKRWIHPHIRSLDAYAVHHRENMIKLDQMENPYEWGDDLKHAWLETLRGISLNRYPDGAASEVIAALRLVFQIPEALHVLLGNGSDELIQTVALAVGGSGRVMLAPEPSFSMYRVIASVTGSQYVSVPRRPDFSIDPETLLDAVKSHDPCCVFLASPNNPTGNPVKPELIEAVAKAVSGIVVVDEAYHAFSETSFLAHASAYPNVLVMRTLSKLGLAGLRLGLVMGTPELINELNKIRLPYNVNVLTQASARFALGHMEWFEAKASLIREARKTLFQSLRGLPGITVYPSAANFLLFRVPTGRADGVFSDLRARCVLIKNLNGVHPQLEDCLRVTVSTPIENEVFFEALKASL